MQVSAWQKKIIIKLQLDWQFLIYEEKKLKCLVETFFFFLCLMSVLAIYKKNRTTISI
jgi:hypothetical protein